MSDKDSSDPKRRRLEGVIPELIKRAVELGVEKATEAPENLRDFVGGMKVPKEVLHYLYSQVDETKNGLFRVVAKELRDFLEHTNMSGEMQKILTTVQFEISTTVRFRPNDGTPAAASRADDDSDADGEKRESPAPRKLSKPEVKTDVRVKRDDRPRESRERRRNRE
jgi:hypothetical protein